MAFPTDYYNYERDMGAMSPDEYRRQKERLREMYERQKYESYSDYGFIQSGTGAVDQEAPKQPAKPKHLNPALLLTKGA